DGIRDKLVTGVQTCALPIFDAAVARPKAGQVEDRIRVLLVEDNRDLADSFRILMKTLGHEIHVAREGMAGLDAARARPFDMILRSEERRVGKEGRSRWCAKA